MSQQPGLSDMLEARGIGRRAFLKYCAGLATLLGLAPQMRADIARGLAQAQRQSVIWLSFQECTGCTESLARADAPDIARLILEYLSLDYHHTLMAPSGEAAEASRRAAMRAHAGRYLVVVDGSIPTAFDGACSTIAGMSNVELLRETAQGAAALVAVGSCAAYGGLPAASPNPTGALPVSRLVRDKPIANVPGCPPVPEVIAAVLVHWLVFGRLPPADDIGRPLAFYGDTIHDRCSRRAFHDQGLFAETFDDAGARAGWCLAKLGCRGPQTHNACATLRWNGRASFPIESGHGCIGCSEPDFWDAGSFYRAALPARAASAPPRGEAIWRESCSYCHGLDPARLRTAPAQVPGLLRERKVRAHDFGLGELELRQLGDWLKQAAKGKK
jgi:hydrogenase small subunit